MKTAELIRYRFETQDGRVLYVYALSRGDALLTAFKAGYPARGCSLREDLEPWTTSLFEERTAPGG